MSSGLTARYSTARYHSGVQVHPSVSSTPLSTGWVVSLTNGGFATSGYIYLAGPTTPHWMMYV
ncbi:hypothetical protein BCR39DRAFT_536790 [Naematelia encephala]|uniref:Uncharacterized protein n=1 Tax=Naematelia encephala TaxID=71784 RepID=A0A1Y2AZJ4_9TREE|nr:hypothetical protein BCR39DRAFT_536790 [Naematelia encephala]